MIKFLVVFITLNSFASDFLPKGFSANFIQKVISEISGKERISQGLLEYQFPGKIKFEITQGGSSLFISNGQKSWYYTPPFIEGEKGNVVIQRSSSIFLSKFFDSLQQGLKDNKLYNIKKSPTTLEFIFHSNVADSIGLKKALFPIQGVDPKQLNLSKLKKMILTRSDNKEIVFELSEFKEKNQFPINHFLFTPPKNTTIQEK